MAHALNFCIPVKRHSQQLTQALHEHFWFNCRVWNLDPINNSRLPRPLVIKFAASLGQTSVSRAACHGRLQTSFQVRAPCSPTTKKLLSTLYIINTLNTKMLYGTNFQIMFLFFYNKPKKYNMLCDVLEPMCLPCNYEFVCRDAWVVNWASERYAAEQEDERSAAPKWATWYCTGLPCTHRCLVSNDGIHVSKNARQLVLNYFYLSWYASANVIFFFV